jgi:hypothetical protein
MDDIATALSDSLSRSGAGGMTAALRGVDGSAGVPAFSFTSDVNTGVYLADADDLRLSAGGVPGASVTPTGLATIGTVAPTIGGVQNSFLTLRDSAGAGIGVLGFFSGPGLSLQSFNHGGTLTLAGEDTSGVLRAILIADPDSDTKLYHAGAEAARTLTGAAGGLEVNNAATGAGFERALTASDLTVTTGTFSPAWTGFGTPPSGFMRWTKFSNSVGSWATLEYESGTYQGTSNATTLTFTNLPVDVRPTLAKQLWVPVTDAAFPGSGSITLGDSGTVTLSAYISGAILSATGFTDAGLKGLPDSFTVTYPLP